MKGALLIDKPSGMSSFGVIETLRKEWRKQGLGTAPTFGHGGTLDPFATGLLVVLVGKAVKLARYFLGAEKAYEGHIRFGEATTTGDPTGSVIETSSHLPHSLELLNETAHQFTLQPYLQIPPMHSAKKKDGQRLYELARKGIEIDREEKECFLPEFKIKNYLAPQAEFEVHCSSGTYIRTLAQDYAKKMDTVAVLETLRRTASGPFQLNQAWTLDQIVDSLQSKNRLNDLPCWVPFDELLNGYPSSLATADEKLSLLQGKQQVVFPLVQKANFKQSSLTASNDAIAIYLDHSLLGVIRREAKDWKIERVFIDS